MIPQSTLNILLTGVAVALVSVAMYTDYRRRIIENSITLPAIVAGLLLNTAANGWQGLLFAVLGAGLGLGLMLVPYLLGGMGGGDVKLMVALGALFGAYAAINIYLYSALFGGVLALIIAICGRQLFATLKRVFNMTKGILNFSRSYNEAGSATSGVKMPYGIPIGLGALCYIIAGGIV